MCAKIARQRADQLVFMQGLAESREQARRLIMAGKVALSSEGLPPGAPPQKVDKPGHPYPEGTVFELLGQERFVSRGAYKLLTILDNFKLDVSGMVCLDAGASTGGFTDCPLQHGATRVYAVDVGKNQLHKKLRADERVINLEGVNLRAAAPELIPEPVDLVVADVSFISLTLILPPCMTWLKSGGLAAVLIKPQFELGPGETVKGVVRDEAARQRAVDKIVRFCTENLHLESRGVLPAAIKAVETVDECVGKVVDATLEMGGIAMITADHGNAEVMVQPDGSPMTAHTTNPVPFILCGAGSELRPGRLADIAPTILDVMGLACPPEMDGKTLILR